MRIELSFLLDKGYFKRGNAISGILEWNIRGERTGSIQILTKWVDPAQPPRLILIYTTTDRRTGEKEDREDVVYMEVMPSNLGKGEVLYFLCPESGKRCRILYKAYGCRIWKSREAYKNRLYYAGQQCSKLNFHNTRYWELDSEINKIYKRRVVGTYRGRITKRFARLQELEFKQQCANHMRWSPAGMTLGLRRSIFDENGRVKPL